MDYYEKEEKQYLIDEIFNRQNRIALYEKPKEI